MIIVQIGNSNIKCSRLGLGTWAIGGGSAWGDNNDNLSIETIRNCPSNGVNLVDTAPAYNFGHSECVVGEALKNRRENFVLSTKCGITWTNPNGAFFSERDGIISRKNLSRESLIQDLDASLKRLKTDYIDIYITHWQSIEPYFTPIEETMSTLNDMKKSGKIRAIGASNVTSEHIKEYLKYGHLDLIQEKYSILDRKVEKELLPICKKNGITLQAYSPLEQGLLTGALPRDYVPPEGSARKGKKWFSPENYGKVFDMLEKWDVYCKKYHTTKSNLAIAWLLAQGDFISILFGARRVANMIENAKASSIVLSKEDIAAMREMAEELD